MKKIGNYGLEIVKKGYDAVAADAYISRQKAEYEAALAEQKQSILELKYALAAAEQTI